MKLLLDTHLLIWTAAASPRLSATARALLDDPSNVLSFSAASIWEIAIKNGRGDPSFQIDVAGMRRRLMANGYAELPVTSDHALAVQSLPMLHKDPFDRVLIAQAKVEGLMLLTADRTVASYPAPVRQV